MRIITRKDVATILGCEETTIKHYVFTNQIPFLKVGKVVKFVESSIYEWIADREVRPNE